MTDNIELFCVSTAAVVDTVLLLAIIERRNWEHVTAPVLLSVGAVWLWHLGDFVHLLLLESEGPVADALQWVSLTTMTTGLALMPSAMLHGVARLGATPGSEETDGGSPSRGLAGSARLSWWPALCYVPLIAVLPAAILLWENPRGRFLETLSPFVKPYLVCIGVALTVSCIGFLRLRARETRPRLRQLLGWMAVALLGFALLLAFVFLHARGAWPQHERLFIRLVVMYPLIPAVIFAYFVVRYNFMQLILERTLVYGAILAVVWLFHRLAMEGLTTTISDTYRVNFAVIEGIAVIALVLVYQPLRQRASEALRYLMGFRFSEWRRRVRSLTAEMSGMVGSRPESILEWFLDSVRGLARVEYAAGWLFDRGGDLQVRRGEAERLPDERAAELLESLLERESMLCTRREAPRGLIQECFRDAGASFSLVIDLPALRGLLLFGMRTGHRDLPEEERNGLMMLGEQLDVTIRNTLLQEERLTAERRALQAEKLSALGLLASTMAHEIKNPLSSIKTIATVLSESLRPDSEHKEDLRLILSEIDRLSLTTSQLLEFARPSPMGTEGTDVAEVSRRTLGVLRHLAKRGNVTINTVIEDGIPALDLDENAIREILFNLISNSIEAAGDGGHMRFSCSSTDDHVVIRVSDDGPGISPEIQDRLFQPFVTTKDTGTGLGLFVVSRRVRELDGEIRCESRPGEGTVFTVRLPRNRGISRKDRHEAEDTDRGR